MESQIKIQWKEPYAIKHLSPEFAGVIEPEGIIEVSPALYESTYKNNPSWGLVEEVKTRKGTK